MAKLIRMVLGGIEDLPVEENQLQWIGYTSFQYCEGNSVIHCGILGRVFMNDDRKETKKYIYNRETFLNEIERILVLKKFFLTDSNYSVNRGLVGPIVHSLHGRLYQEKPKQAFEQQK